MDTGLTLLGIAAALAGGSGFILLLVYLWTHVRPAAGASRQSALEMECTICHKHLVFGATELAALSPTEIALVVRLHPTIIGKKLYEYVCPYCAAAHCFVHEHKKFSWVSVNSYNPQTITANCMECGNALARPPWPRGQFDETLYAVPQLRDEYGLICSRCGARCCVGCCKKASPRRELPFLCPRCHRRPIEKFLHF